MQLQGVMAQQHRKEGLSKSDKEQPKVVLSKRNKHLLSPRQPRFGLTLMLDLKNMELHG